ncbi:unnamed protein product [Rhizophagus irregularis]|nr:unnamed protein product [Rhizophagus irregularis]
MKKKLLPVVNYHYDKFHILKFNHPHYCLLTYNDYLIQHNHIPSTRSLLSLPPNSNLNSSYNHNLMDQLIVNREIINELKYLSDLLSSFNFIDFYTDGSYDSEANQNERFNKINNNILWSTVHHIIDKLNLHITLHKVKAHSNNAFNDIADAQAKVGHFHQTPTSINHRHLPSQMITIEWNNEIPIDKDVRKCIGTISNYKRIEDHLNHPSLIDIKEATAQHIINWSCTSKWFNYNGHETATSTQHIKDTAWKIKRSTLNLPTLDILNRNFPKLIKNHTCLL